MKYKKFILEDVFQLIDFVTENEIFYINSQKKVVKHTAHKNNILYDKSIQISEKWGKQYLLNENIFFDKMEFKKLFKNENIYKSLILNEKELLIKKIDFEEEKVDFGLYNFDTDEILWKSKTEIIGNPYCLISNTSFISIFQNGLNNYSSKLELNWQLNFSDLLGSNKASLNSDIVENNGKLYFFLTGTERQRTFCVDAETGKVLNEYYELISFSKIENNVLYNLSPGQLVNILDISSNTITSWDIEGLLQQEGFVRADHYRWTVHKGLIYFTQSLGSHNAKAGILDPTKRELIWKHDFDKKHGAIGGIDASDNRIYVHTQDNTLHVFEREE